MNLLQAAESLGLVLKKVASTKGGEYASACPDCGGVDRFRVWPASRDGQGSFWCRQCNKWGDLVQFLVEFSGYNYPDAFKSAGREKPSGYPPKDWSPQLRNTRSKFEPKVFEEPNSQWKKKALKLVENAHKKLLQTNNILEYLEKRGLDILAVKNFNIGWFPGENGRNCMFRPRASWGLPSIKKTNGKDKMLWMPRGIVIPCYKNGDIYRIRIRRSKEDIQLKNDMKYYVVPGSGMEAMGINLTRQAFVIVESELDGMLIARRAGSLVGVIALGNAQTKPGSSTYTHLKKAIRILVSLDYDTAGQTSWKWWKDNFRSSKIWPVPEKKDPGEYFEKQGNIKLWIKDGLPPRLTMDYDTGHKYPPNLYLPKNCHPIQELQFFLKRFPIKIIADKKRHEVVFSPGLQNRQIRKRVKQLFFEDEDLFYYLKLIHPESVIHKDTFKFESTKELIISH